MRRRIVCLLTLLLPAAIVAVPATHAQPPPRLATFELYVDEIYDQLADGDGRVLCGLS